MWCMMCAGNLPYIIHHYLLWICKLSSRCMKCRLFSGNPLVYTCARINIKVGHSIGGKKGLENLLYGIF